MSFHSNTRVNTQFSFAHAWRTFYDVLAMAREWRARAVMRRTLSEATDRQLRDAGIIRQDIEDACDLPLTRSAASAIRTAARIKSANW